MEVRCIPCDLRASAGAVSNADCTNGTQVVATNADASGSPVPKVGIPRVFGAFKSVYRKVLRLAQCF